MPIQQLLHLFSAIPPCFKTPVRDSLRPGKGMTDAERLQRESGAGPSTGLTVRTVGIQVRACRLGWAQPCHAEPARQGSEQNMHEMRS